MTADKYERKKLKEPKCSKFEGLGVYVINWYD